MRYFLAVIVSVGIASCASSQQIANKTMSPIDVTRNASGLVGKQISIKGYLRFGDDAHGLWTSERFYLRARNGDADPKDTVWTNCVNLNADNPIATHLRGLSGQRVVITGVVSIERHGNDDIFAFSCNDTTLNVTKAGKTR